jgi:hypothetical protein
MWIDGGGTVMVTGAAVTDSTAGFGGAFAISSGSLTVNGSSITNSTATCGDGGAMAITGGDVTVAGRSTILNSIAEEGGGAFALGGSPDFCYRKRATDWIVSPPQLLTSIRDRSEARANNARSEFQTDFTSGSLTVTDGSSVTDSLSRCGRTWDANRAESDSGPGMFRSGGGAIFAGRAELLELHLPHFPPGPLIRVHLSLRPLHLRFGASVTVSDGASIYNSRTFGSGGCVLAFTCNVTVSGAVIQKSASGMSGGCFYCRGTTLLVTAKSRIIDSQAGTALLDPTIDTGGQIEFWGGCVASTLRESNSHSSNPHRRAPLTRGSED